MLTLVLVLGGRWLAAQSAVTAEVLWQFIDVDNVATPSPASLESLRYIYGGLVETSAGIFYGTGTYGGELGDAAYNQVNRGFGYGGVFRLDVRGPAPVLTKVHQFACGNDSGYPSGVLIRASDGMLYGTLYGFTSSDCDGFGRIFRVNPSNDETTILYAFDGTEGCCAGQLVDAGNGILYGLGNKNEYGNIFSFDTTTNALTTIFQFDDSRGRYPTGLLLASDRWLYGATGYGPAQQGTGALFRLNPADPGLTFSIIHIFNDPLDGTGPRGDMVETSPGVIYGNTYSGGATGNGVIFRMTVTGGSAAVAPFVSLGPAENNVTGRMLLASDGYLYGTAYNYGGAVYRVNISGATPNVEYLPMDLHGGIFANAGLVEGSDHKLYGTTTLGGPASALDINSACYPFGGCGVAFRFSPPPGSGTPTNKDQCKGNGWRSFTNPSFANQGQCVSFVQRKK